MESELTGAGAKGGGLQSVDWTIVGIILGKCITNGMFGSCLDIFVLIEGDQT